ncbi:MAG: hypothetical protein OXH61_00435 [Acidimicrobiaceae bacterium]|nr:hypothetical protein [Acidimicrobiaceae bacterium]
MRNHAELAQHHLCEHIRTGAEAGPLASEGIQPSILEEIAEVIGRINAERGIAVLAVEQNLDFAVRIARRSLIMEKGEIIAEVSTTELRGDRELQKKYLAL